MTDEQLKHVVEHLCEHLHLAIRLKDLRLIRLTPRSLDSILHL